MEVTKVSKEAIEKAEIALGLKKAFEPTVEEKAKQDELKKAEEAKATIEKEYADVLQKAQELKAKMEGDTTVKEIVKSEEVKPFNTDALEKSIVDKFNEKFEALGTLIKSKDEVIDKLSEKLEKAEEFNTVLGKKVGILEKQPMGERKSVTTTNFLEKGGDNSDKSKKNETVMSLSNKNDRSQVAELLLEKALEDKEKGIVDNFFKKAVTYVELQSIPDTETSARIQRFLKDNHKIVLTK